MGVQTVFRIDGSTNRAYTKICNHLLQDPRISHETKGLICELISRPLDWEITVKGIIKSGKSGRDKVYRMVKEAVKYGYIIDDQNRRGGGKFDKQNYIVTDDPETLEMRYKLIASSIRENAPLTENPEAVEMAENKPFPEKPEAADCGISPLPEKPFTAKPFTANRTQQRKEDNKRKKETKSQTKICDEASKQKKPKKYSYPERFETFWRIYSRCCKNRKSVPGTKREAFEEWKIMEAWELEAAEKGLKAYVASCDEAEQSLKHCCRYLTHKAWEAFEDLPLDLDWFQHPRVSEMPAEFFKTKLEEYAPNGKWNNNLGPPPGHEKCAFPEKLYAELGIDKYRIGGL